ncbi:N-acetylneuraminate 9-O-acetyltransferase-like [Liolophura sinensis]|uniref:N-acetylneuraminate 9-O-acetyltransferase-like n=1 Tax=Liolophura sinensis TaxID=3198878 RepID=UPI00315976DD
MQLFLLLCNFTGADQALPLTFAVRAFVSSYLFLFAFGHFSYFWSTQSISIGRLFQIIFRLNLLTITLCLVTWKSYTTHFFVLLATGWFLIICVTMATCARMIQLQLGGNRSYKAVYIKLVLWFVVITVACGFGILWKAGFAILPVSLTQPNGSVPEWIWRLQLDRYTVIGGLAFACTYHYIKQRSSVDYLKTENKHGRKLSIGVFLVCVICLTVYGLSSLKCVGQLDCLDVYPFVSLIPVISFVVLRNQFTYFRSRYSPVFAWFGKMSLELYISQYHIWMADDGHSILVLVPGYPILNFILTTCLLVSVCVELNKITNALAKVIRDLWTAVVS